MRLTKVRLPALIEAHEDSTGQAVRTAIADARYGSLSNLVECQKSQIRPHLKLLGDSHRGELRTFCTRSRSGRTIHRHRDQELLDRARKIANSKAAKEDLKRQQHLIERSFADASNCHGFKRARWRGLWKQSIQDLLIATIQNLRKLVRYLCQTKPQLAYRCAERLRRLSRLLLNRLPALLPI